SRASSERRRRQKSVGRVEPVSSGSAPPDVSEVNATPNTHTGNTAATGDQKCPLEYTGIQDGGPCKPDIPFSEPATQSRSPHWQGTAHHSHRAPSIESLRTPQREQCPQ